MFDAFNIYVCVCRSDFYFAWLDNLQARLDGRMDGPTIPNDDDTYMTS